jgi:hypothetical protein
MVAIFREAVTSMLWFRVKMILVVLVVLNGVAMARPSTLKLRKLLLQDGAGNSAPIEGVRRRLTNIYVSQIILFLIIFILSVFKF